MISRFFQSNLIYKFLPLLVIIAGTIPAIAAITRPGFFPMHDDLQAMRQLQMAKCFADFQIPCRWVPDMGYGFGYPIFNYYPPLPYYLGEIFYSLGVSILDTVKILFILVFLLSAVSMYFLAKEFWGRTGGVVSALFYVWAPYHAVDVYVRGAMNEAWALVFFPAILWSIYKMIEKGSWIFILLAATFSSFLLLSHIPTLLVFVPGALLWSAFWLWQKKSLSALPKLITTAILTAGLAAFFFLPLVFELKYVHAESLFIGYFNYLAHFLNLNQLFISRYWGYGESVFGPADTMSFSLGHLHWFGTIVALFVAWQIRKTKPKTALTIIFFFAWTYFFTFLTHQRAALIWRVVPILANLQFPWRILALSTVGTSFLAGSFFLLLPKLHQAWRWLLAATLIVVLIILNRPFFTWREFFPQMTDSQKFSGKLWQLQQTSGIFDYLPKQIPLPPPDPPNGDAKFISGNGDFRKVVKRSNLQAYQVSVVSEMASFQINTFYFPGWQLTVDGKEVATNPYRDKVNGTMIVDLPKGAHLVKAKFKNTAMRTVSDIISLISWLILFYFVAFRLKIFLKSKVLGR